MLYFCAPGAEAVEPEAVVGWFASEQQSSLHALDLGSFSIRWHVEDFNTLSAAELNDLRQLVQANPDHPRARELEAAEQQVRDGKTTMGYRLFSSDRDHWRFCRDPNSTSFWDVAYSPELSWQMQNSTAIRFDPEVAASGSDIRQNPKSNLSVFGPEVDRLLFGSIGSVARLGLKPGPVSISTSGWTIVCESTPAKGQSFALTFQGSWSEELHRGFVGSCTISKSDFAPQKVGEAQIFVGWKKDATSDRWVASRIDLVHPGGLHWRSVVFDAIEPLPSGGLKAVLGYPGRGQVDVVRPEARPAEFLDLSRRTSEAVQADGSVVVGEIPKDKDPRSEGNAWRWGGWFTIGALAVAGVFLRLRRAGARAA